MEKPLKLIIEALLFTADKPLRVRDILACVEDETPADVREALNELRAEYDAMGRSFTLKEVAEGFQLRTQSEYAPYVVRMLKTSPARLSRAAMETLAIIAYKQPIMRADVEVIRGVAAGEMVRNLMYKGLVKIVGRAEVLGRPMLYGTTKNFLQHFGLNSIKDLPKAEELKKPE